MFTDETMPNAAPGLRDRRSPSPEIPEANKIMPAATARRIDFELETQASERPAIRPKLQAVGDQSAAPPASAGRNIRRDSPGITDVVDDWLEAVANETEAFNKLSAAERSAFAHYPAAPELIEDPARPGRPRSYFDLEEMDAATRRQLRSEGSPRLETLEVWETQCAAIRYECGVQDAEHAARQASQRADDLAERIATMRATTAKEAALKFNVLLSLYVVGQVGIDQQTKLFSFLADLEALAAVDRSA